MVAEERPEKKKHICEAMTISKELLSLCFYRPLSSK